MCSLWLNTGWNRTYKQITRSPTNPGGTVFNCKIMKITYTRPVPDTPEIVSSVVDFVPDEDRAMAIKRASEFVARIVDFDNGLGAPVPNLDLVFDDTDPSDKYVDEAIETLVFLEAVGVEDRDLEGISIFVLDEVAVERIAFYGCSELVAGVRYCVHPKALEVTNSSAVA